MSLSFTNLDHPPEEPEALVDTLQLLEGDLER